jgi:phage terminase large subunit-like protein
VSDPAESDRRIAELEAILADPARHREVAARFVELECRCERLEQRCEQLANEIERVDQRLTKARLERWDIP